MTKIAICDTKHFEVTYTLISLFDKKGTGITIFIHSEAFDQLKSLLGERINLFTWFIKDKDEPNRRFINRMFKEINNSSFDLLYLNTIADNFVLYAHHLQRLKIKRIVMTLHDINGSFNYKPSFSIRRIVRYAGKRKLIRITPCFNVLSEGLTHHLKAKLQNKKQVFTIPGSYFEPELFIKKEYQQGEVIKIAVPGSVDNRRRNYEIVFELLHAARQLNLNIAITLLGSFSPDHSWKIRQQCLEYGRSNKDLHIHEREIVPQSEFDQAMSESHFVWMPLQPFVIINDGIKEEYGVSICSGNTGDVIRYAKPFFAPSGLKMDTALAESCRQYVRVPDIIKNLQTLNPESYDRLQEKARMASMHYTREKIINRNAPLFL